VEKKKSYGTEATASGAQSSVTDQPKGTNVSAETPTCPEGLDALLEMNNLFISQKMELTESKFLPNIFQRPKIKAITKFIMCLGDVHQQSGKRY